MDFPEYLKSKKIDPTALKKIEPQKFDDLRSIFDQIHPNSFTQQKLYLINPLRRKYKLSDEVEAPKAKPKPMRPNPDSYRDAKPKI